MITNCYVPRLAAIAAFAIAIPQYALARDAGHDAAVKLAMGPISAAQKNQNQVSRKSSDIGGIALTKPHRSTKHKRSAR